MRALRHRRVDRSAASEIADAIRFRRSSMPRTTLGRDLLGDDGSTDLTVTRTVQPIMDDRRGRWTWQVRAKVGPRLDCTSYTEAPRGHHAPLTWCGVAASGLDADMDAREVEAMMRSHFARLILVSPPMVVET